MKKNDKIEDMSLSAQISTVIKDSEKLNKDILAKEKQISSLQEELNSLKIGMIEYDEKIAVLVKKRARISKKMLDK
jgi:septal ring factor EnvC (AmiA/AmiB activator)